MVWIIIAFFLGVFVGVIRASLKLDQRYFAADRRADYWYWRFVKHIEYINQRPSEYGSSFDEDDDSESWKNPQEDT